MKRNRSAVAEIRRIIRRCDIDIVHVNTTWTYVGALAAKAQGIPCVWHLREFLEEDQGCTIWSRTFANRLIAASDKAIAISNRLSEKYRNIIPLSRLEMIGNGINVDQYYRPKHIIMQNEPYTFVFLGNFKRHKGHIDFSKACARVFQRGLRNFRIWFVGAGDPIVRSECEKIFADAGMESLVAYHGFQKFPEVFLEKADVAFTCSRNEAWGRVTVEAMMAGCLVVGPDTGATPELIENRKTGFLFHYEQGNHEDLSSAIKEAASNPYRSRRIADAGRRRAVAEMSSTRNADNVFEIYKTIIPR